jgi:hypothetical protein
MLIGFSVSMGCADVNKNLIIENNSLSCLFNNKDNTFTITDLRTKQVWTSLPPVGVELISSEQREKDNIELILRDKPTCSEFICLVSLGPGAILSYELDTKNKEIWPEAINKYPPVFVTDFRQKSSLVFCDRSCGALIDQRDKLYSNKTLKVYGCHDCLSMPWIGIVSEDGQGLMILFETPTDAAVNLYEDENGINWPHVRWLPSMHSFRYPRKVSYRFYPAGGYVKLAKEYKQYLVNNKRFKTLKQKAAERPRVNWLKGAPSIWGWKDHNKFYPEAINFGIKRAVLSCGSEALPIPCEDVDKMTEQGWLAGSYDCYTDILEGPTGRHRGNIVEASIRPAPGEGALKGWVTEDGLQYYSRSSALAIEAAKSYVPDDLKKYHHTTRFIDVSAAIDLFEDYHPAHTFDRRGDMENRRKLYQYFNDLGLVVRGEFGNAWVVDKVDMLMGAMSYNPLNLEGNSYLKYPKKEQITDEYRNYAMGYAIRIPLWELVFHECVVNTWYWGDTAGFLYDVAPDLSDRKDLFNILYGTVPLIWFQGHGYKWNKSRDRLLQTYQDTCLLHEVIAFDEMVNHEFLTDDKTLQKTQFDSGTIVVVNFGEHPQTYEHEGKKVILAPCGYYIISDQVEQHRLWKDNEPVTLIRKDGYLVIETTTQKQIGPVELQKRMSAFRVSDVRWNLILQNWVNYKIDIPALTGWDEKTNYKLMIMSGNGELLRPLEYKVNGHNVSFRTQQGERLIALIKN